MARQSIVLSNPTLVQGKRQPFVLRSTLVLERSLFGVIVLAAATGTAVDLGRAFSERGIGSEGGLLATLAGPLPPILAAFGAALAWNRPRWGTAVLLAAPLLAALLQRNVVVSWSILALGVFLIALRSGGGRVLAPLGAGVAYLCEVLPDLRGLSDPSAFAALAVTFAAAATGSAIREHRAFLASLEERAREMVDRRELEASARLTAERLRIARDLHDLVGHQVAVVNMHISMAEVALPDASDASRQSLAAARSGVRSILQESQRILEVLRRGADAVDDGNAPVPSVDGIGALLATYRAIGLRVDSSIDAVPTGIEDGVGATVYRVLQEGLTNAHRYGDGTARVELRLHAPQLVLTVENPIGAGAPAGQGSGFGLLGLRERLETVGGRLDVEQEARAFRISATVRMDGRSLA